MGIKGGKQNQESVISADLFLEKLQPIGDIKSKRMFGGHGIFYKGNMFAIIDSRGQSYLKVDESTRAEFEKRGSHKHSRMPYYSVPNDVIMNQDELIRWTLKCIEILI
jgi:DNA transformation protein and related proteins